MSNGVTNVCLFMQFSIQSTVIFSDRGTDAGHSEHQNGMKNKKQQVVSFGSAGGNGASTRRSEEDELSLS